MKESKFFKNQTAQTKSHNINIPTDNWWHFDDYKRQELQLLRNFNNAFSSLMEKIDAYILL